MRVLHVTGDVFRYNGAARQAIKLASALRAFGCESSILAHSTDAHIGGCVEGIGVRTVPYGDASSFLGTCLELLRFRPDVVHSHGFFHGAIAAGKAFRRPVLLKTTLVGVDDLPSVVKSGRLRSAVARSADLNNAVATYIAAINSTVVSKERVAIVPNGTFIPSLTSLAKQSPRLVLVVGVEERKRPDIAIKFFCGAHKDSSVTELELIGPWRNEAYRQSCLRSIPQRLSNKIRFLGEMSFEQVQAKMAAATALLFASDQEGFPNVVIEAMAHNCVPIIIGADAGAREAIARGGGVALRESDELNWSELDRMIEAHVPYESARAQFDIALTARRHLELYKRLSSRKKTPSTTVRAISG